MDTELEIVQQRIDMRGRDVGIGGEVLRRVEGVRGYPSLLPAVKRIRINGLEPTSAVCMDLPNRRRTSLLAAR